MTSIESQNDIFNILSGEQKFYKDILASAKTIKKLSTAGESSAKLEKEILKLEDRINKKQLSSQLKDPIEAFYLPIKKSLSTAREEQKREFGKKLDAELKNHGIELQGHYPLLKASFFAIQTDFEKGKAIIWYGPEQEKISETPLNPEKITKAVVSTIKHFEGKGFQDEVFLSRLYDAYKTASVRSNKNTEEDIPIMSVLLEYLLLIQDNKFKANPLKSNFKEYTRANFSYDLFRLKQRTFNGKELKLAIATRAFSTNRADFLWIPANDKGDGSYYSHIRFREAGHGS